jgi:MFS family permease
MFLEYAPAGALVPLFSLRLQELGFTPGQIGWACATQALATLVGPLAAGQVADRWWPAERGVTVCALVAAAFLWLLAGTTGPWAVVLLTLGFWLFMAPAISLGAAITLSHLADPPREYGRVRLWGTVGWMVPGWLLGYWFCDPPWLCRCLGCLGSGLAHSELADAFRLAALFAVALGVWGLALPHTPPRRRLGSPLATLGALRLLRDRSFAVFALGNVCVYLTAAFSSQGTPLLLQQLGVSRPWLSPLQTLSQGTEIVSLSCLPLLLPRLGMRRTMLAGLAAWTLGLAAFTAGRPLWLVVAMQGTWGLAVCGYLVTGQVFANGRARGDIRASVQALLPFTGGLGMLLGNLLAGWVREQAGGALAPTFAVAAAVAAGSVLVFALGFGGAARAAGAASYPEGAAAAKIRRVP